VSDREALETIGMKITQSALSRWTKRVGSAIAVVALTSMLACERETPQAQSAKPDAKVSDRVPPKPSDEAVQPTAPPASQPADLQPLVGRWGRTDGGYVIEIQTVRDDGTLEAAYYNPGPINVARAEAGEKDHGLEVFIELRDVNYPGSTYTLVYDRVNDRLQGIYYQAVARQNYEVVFVRQ